MAKYLRICGFDTLFKSDYTDPVMVEIAEKEKRIILTRDRAILKNSRVTHGYWIRSQKHDEQIREVISRFDLKNHIRFFTRCTICNASLKEVNKEDILDQLKEKTRRYYSEFKRCPDCNRIFWCGSHYEKMTALITHLVND